MKFQVIDYKGDVVDRNLSYQAALMYIDNHESMYYIMEPMKEDDHE